MHGALNRAMFVSKKFLVANAAMRVKLTAKNQLTLPKAITDAIGPVEYFDVRIDAGRITLTPVRGQRADAVRAKLAELNLDDRDMADAARWARKRDSKARKS